MADDGAPRRPDGGDFSRWMILGGMFTVLGTAVVTRGVLMVDRLDSSPSAVGQAIGTILVAALGVYGLWLLATFARRLPAHLALRLAPPIAMAAICIVTSGLATWMFVEDPVRAAQATAALSNAEDPLGTSADMPLSTTEVDVPPDWEPGGVEDGIAFFFHEHEEIEGNVVALTYDGDGRWTRSFVERFMLECIGEIRGEQGYRQLRAEVLHVGPRASFVIDFDVVVEGMQRSSRMQVALGDNGVLVTTTTLVPPGELDTYDAQLSELARVVETDLLGD